MSDTQHTPGDYVQVLYSARSAPKRARGNFYRVLECWGFNLILVGPLGGRIVVEAREVLPILTAKAEGRGNG